MPPVAVAVAAIAVSAGVTGAVLGATIAGVTIGLAGAAFIGGLAGMATSMLGSALIGSPSEPGISEYAQGALLNRAGNVEPIPVIYGSRRVGGCRVFMGARGSNNEYLDIVMAFCEGPISHFHTVYFNDIPSTDARFNNLHDIREYWGVDDQAADSFLVSNQPDWTTNHRLRGVAYLGIWLKWDQNTFSGGLPDVSMRNV